MDISTSDKEKIDGLNPMSRLMVDYIIGFADGIINGMISEDDIVSSFARIKQCADARYGVDDLMNYDQAGKALGFGCTNRVGLKRLLDENKIKQVVINNMKCGFRRKDIEALAERCHNDIMRRENCYKKRKRKALRK